MAIRNLGKTIESLQTVALGQVGADWLDDTSSHDGDWAVITAMEDATFVELNTSTVALNDVAAVPATLNGKTLAKGLTIYGRFTRIHLSLGAVIAYRSGVAG